MSIENTLPVASKASMDAAATYVRVIRDGHSERAALVDVVSDTAKDITTSTYTVLSTDRRLRFPQACVVTMPANLGSNFECGFMRTGSGVVSFVQGSGATLVSDSGLTTLARINSGCAVAASGASTYLLLMPSEATVALIIKRNGVTLQGVTTLDLVGGTIALANGVLTWTASTSSGGDTGTGGNTGGGDSAWTEPEVITPVMASRMLNQAAFGANPDSVAALQMVGIEGWIDQQLAMPAAPEHYFFDNRGKDYTNPTYHIQNVFNLLHARWIFGQDKLRSRLVAALQGYIVASVQNGQIGESMPPWADVLYFNAFKTYKDIIKGVCYSAAQSNYLTYRKNEGQVPTQQADENFARELLQLFTIGLNELNLDGSDRTYAQLPQSDPRYDANNHAVCPTYNQYNVSDCAKVWTGATYGVPTGMDWEAYVRTWNGGDDTWNGVDKFPAAECRYRLWDNLTDMGDWQRGTRTQWPLYFCGDHHNLGAKLHLINGLTIPAFTGTWTGLSQSTTRAELDAVDAYAKNSVDSLIDAICAHPNVAPFVSVRLIKSFIKSNPSPAYIARVATVFNNNGSGVRGDMKAVLKAVLLDVEARDESYMSDPATGKIREPMLRYFNMAEFVKEKALFHNSEHYSYADYIGLDYLSPLKQQAFYQSSVFGYLPPDYRDPSLPLGLTSPEAKMMAESSIIEIMNNPSGRGNWVYSKEARAVDTNAESAYSVYNSTDSDGISWLFRKYLKPINPDNGGVLYQDGTPSTDAVIRANVRAMLDDMNLYLAAGQISSADLDDMATIPSGDPGLIRTYCQSGMYDGNYPIWIYQEFFKLVMQNYSYQVLK